VKKFFAESDFRDICSPGKFAKIWSDFCKNRVFQPEIRFSQKNFANIFAMSAAVSPWGGGFKSCFSAKSEICGIFRCISRKLCFSATPFFNMKCWLLSRKYIKQ
jgi:hypothetical protein